MTRVSKQQIPECFWANRPIVLQWLGKAILTVFDWRVCGSISEEYNNKRLVAIVAPHTSNWDGIFGVAAVAGLDARITFIGKHTVFRFGLGKFLSYMGGIPVDRSKPGGIIKNAIDQIRGIDGAIIALSPEGTRSKVKEWKTGFLRIASELNADIISVSLDFKKREILLGNVFLPSGDNERDIKLLKEYYSVFTAKNPDKY
jgi:1-acyl-sn-glycerol-3-phosphate acyltransferase